MSDSKSIQPSEPEQSVVKQLPYRPKSQGQPVDTLIPVNMQAATTKALNTLEQQVGPIDVYVADRLGYGSPEALHKYFSAEQVDASALALSNLEKQSGFIIGDQTGVGKGRVVAAMIRYAKATGHTPIFVTQNPMLYADIMRDLRDIGWHDFKPFPTNSDLNIPLGTQQVLKTSKKTHEAELQSFIRSGSLGDYDGIFTTYSQMQSVKGKETLRRDFLRAFASNAILVMDESHVAGGTKSEWGQGNAVPNRAQFARELIERSAGVFYSSATYAKRPDVMDLYAKTDMRLAVEDIHSLVSMIETGGVPMQQALAAQLTEAGQYVRRERSYEGVSFNLEVVPVNREIAEQISATLAGILEFDRAKQVAIKELDKTLKAEAKAILGDNAVGRAGVESVNFTAVMHNLIDQTLLAMKAEATVQKALELLRQPDSQKPVIALSSTMGSFIGDYARLHQLKPGDAISLDSGDLLKRYLERSRDIIVGSPYGEKTRQRLSDEQLGPVGVRQYEQVLEQINQTDFSSIPISPIDYIKARLSQSGYPVGEVTGRKDTIDYARDGSSTYEQRSVREISKAAAIETVRAFNNGDQDVIILNCSGSTGISLHASSQFQDQRQRHMIVVQPEKDINQFMQMLGRIHRTGQVEKPNFTLLNADIPAEKRPAAVLAKKMASLNANTTAARSSGISLDAVTDFMNDYGDRVVAELLQSNPGLNRKLDYPLSELDTQQDSTPSLISRVTGRLPLLPLAEQERVYTMIEREYGEYVQRQEAMGESMLEAQSLDLDARTIARMEVVSGDSERQSPFTSPVYLEVVDAKALRKPMTTLEVMNLVREELGLKPVADPSEHDVEQVIVQSKQASTETRQTLVQAVELYRTAAQAQTSSEKGVEKLNTRLNTQLNHVGRTLDTFPVGEPVRAVTETGNIFYGVVCRVWHNTQEAGENPVTPSTWKLQILVADPARQLVLPLSQVNVDQPNAVRITPQSVNWDGVDIYDVFDQKQSRGREERQIFTGNLLRAYEKFNGKLINYTDNQGQTRQGLLTPQGFDIEESIEKQPVEIPTAQQVIAFITEATQSKGQVKTLNETLTVKPQHQRAGDGFVLQTPKPRELGGRYYLDETLLRAAGSEFYSIGDRMECIVPKERIDAVLQRVMQDKGISLAAFEHRDTAREMLGVELPRLEQIQRGEFEAKANYTPVVPDVDGQTRSRLEQLQLLESSSQPESQADPVILPPQPPEKPVPETSRTDPKNVSGLPKQEPQADAHSPAELASPETRSSGSENSNTVTTQVAPPERQRGAAEKNVARLLERAGLAEVVLQGDDFHARIENEPFIPLVIECHSDHLYLTHYRELNGDLCLDAEMVFQVSNTGALALKETAVADPNRGGEYRRCDRGFAQIFSQNLLHQKFAEAALQPTKAATAEPQLQSSSQSVDPASTVRNTEADAPSPAPGKSIAFEAQTTPAQLRHADTAIERLPEDSKSSVSTVPIHTPSTPSEKEDSRLVAWQQVAKALNRPDNYLNRIVEITKAYQAGEPVSTEATSAMQGDLAAHERSLAQLRDWHRAARFLGHSDRYQQRVVEVANAFKAGAPVSERAIQAMSQDLSVHQQKLEALVNWQRVARAIGQPEDYCARITKVVETCKAGCPLSDRAKIAMRQDLRCFQQAIGKVVMGQAVRKTDIELGE